MGEGERGERCLPSSQPLASGVFKSSDRSCHDDFAAPASRAGPESLMCVYEDSAAESGSGMRQRQRRRRGRARGRLLAVDPAKPRAWTGWATAAPPATAATCFRTPCWSRPPAPWAPLRAPSYTDIPAPEAAHQCATPPAPHLIQRHPGLWLPVRWQLLRLPPVCNVNLQQKPCAYHSGDKYPEPSNTPFR